MSSINISITEDVYNMLKSLKKENESFSDVIREILSQKDITRCFGLLKDYPEEVAQLEAEVMKARKAKWREVNL